MTLRHGGAASPPSQDRRRKARIENREQAQLETNFVLVGESFESEEEHERE